MAGTQAVAKAPLQHQSQPWLQVLNYCLVNEPDHYKVEGSCPSIFFDQAYSALTTPKEF